MLKASPLGQRKTGRVLRIFDDYGFVSCDDLPGKDVYFRLLWFKGTPPLQVGEPVTFELKSFQQKPQAHDVSRQSVAMSEGAPRQDGVTLKAPAEVQYQGLREVAFYYPGHLWRNSEWIKTLLLFFDGIGLLIPEYKQGEPEIADPVLAGPLREQGLLHYLIADRFVDKEATEKLATALTQFIASGAFDSLMKDGSHFDHISMSRMGYYGDAGLANMLFEELEARGLARKSRDGISVPVHPAVRYLILVLLAQILRPGGTRLGLDLSPTTDQVHIVRTLTRFLDLPAAPSAGHVIAFDLQSVSVDLSSVPLDEVLGFRSEYRLEHRQYVRSVREFARAVSLMPADERAAAFADRQAEVDDLANDLRRRARAAWKRPASFALGLAGAAWTYATGDPIGALLGAGNILVSESGSPDKEAGAFSYLFAAHGRYA